MENSGSENPYTSPSGAVPQDRPNPLPEGTVKNYLMEAMLCLLCCAGPIAVPAIVFAAQVNPKLARGDFDGAVDSSANARKWLIIAVVCGCMCGGGAMLLELIIMLAQQQS